MTKEKPNSRTAMHNARGSHEARRRGAAALDPDLVAMRAFTFIADDPRRLADFMALTGVGPEALRESLGTPAFMRGVLAHVMSDERLLLDVAAHLDLPPAELDGLGRAVLGE